MAFVGLCFCHRRLLKLSIWNDVETEINHLYASITINILCISFIFNIFCHVKLQFGSIVITNKKTSANYGGFFERKHCKKISAIISICVHQNYFYQKSRIYRYRKNTHMIFCGPRPCIFLFWGGRLRTPDFQFLGTPPLD